MICLLRNETTRQEIVCPSLITAWDHLVQLEEGQDWTQLHQITVILRAQQADPRTDIERLSGEHFLQRWRNLCRWNGGQPVDWIKAHNTPLGDGEQPVPGPGRGGQTIRPIP